MKKHFKNLGQFIVILNIFLAVPVLASSANFLNIFLMFITLVITFVLAISCDMIYKGGDN